jgi:fructose-bisphosphate aldolase class II
MLANGIPLLKTADKNGYAQAAFNVNTLEQINAAVEIHEALRAPLFIQGAQLSNAFLGGRADFKKGSIEDIKRGANLLGKYVSKKSEQTDIPMVLHLDHGKSFDVIKACVDGGYTSVMIDGSSLPYDENVALTRKVSDYAHQYDVSVEGELGVIAGVEDHVFSQNSTYTNPLKALDFIKKTKIDSLAVSYGTKHGANKGKNVKLRLQVIVAIKELLLGEGLDVNIVSHGSSTIPSYIVAEINQYGGDISGSGGIPIDQLKRAIKCGVNKINIDSDIRLACTRNMREISYLDLNFYQHDSVSAIFDLLSKYPHDIDPRTFLAPVMPMVTENKTTDKYQDQLNKLINLGTKEIMGSLIVQFGMVGKAPLVKENLEK